MLLVALLRAGEHRRQRANGLVSLLFGMLACCICVPASAHELSPAYLGLTEIAPDRFAVHWKVSISGGLIRVLVPELPANCALLERVRSSELDDAHIQQGTFDCAGGLAGQRIAIPGLADTATDALVYIRDLEGRAQSYRLTPARVALELPPELGALEVMRTYSLLGIEHILVGLDHLLFVLALLLLVRGWKVLFWTITAFTLAHSLTLAAAVLGLVNVPPAPVESVIALSILFLATELARVETRVETRVEVQRDLAQRLPWVAALLFGLLHGLGFAGALTELGLPADAVPLALLFFNLGVEAGQLLFLALVFSLVWALRQLALPVPKFWRACTLYTMGALASLWFFERTVVWLI